MKRPSGFHFDVPHPPHPRAGAMKKPKRTPAAKAPARRAGPRKLKWSDVPANVRAEVEAKMDAYVHAWGNAVLEGLGLPPKYPPHGPGIAMPDAPRGIKSKKKAAGRRAGKRSPR